MYRESFTASGEFFVDQHNFAPKPNTSASIAYNTMVKVDSWVAQFMR